MAKVETAIAKNAVRRIAIALYSAYFESLSICIITEILSILPLFKEQKKIADYLKHITFNNARCICYRYEEMETARSVSLLSKDGPIIKIAEWCWGLTCVSI